MTGDQVRRSGRSTRVALITGGGSGVGMAAVFRFLRDGYRVAFADLNEEHGAAVVRQAVEEGHEGRVRFVRADVSREDDVRAAVAVAAEEFGGLDVLFNNAGVGGAFGPIEDISVQDWDYTFGILVRGVFLGIKHAVPVMRSQGRGGVIVNTASAAGLTAGAGPQAYSAAKAAVINLTQSAAAELAPDRIRVNAICPGVIATPLVHQGREQQILPRLDAVQPWPEHGRPEDVAGVAAFLASADAQFITGESILVDGGLLAAGPRLADVLGNDPRTRGLAGVNRGSTGQSSVVRNRESR